jgi:hypothetical protein
MLKSKYFSKYLFLFFLITGLFLIMPINSALAGFELVCQGSSPSSNNKKIIVDCNSRIEVIRALKSSWSTLRRNEIGGSMENMCWDPYQRAKALHPSISFNGIAQTFFAQCNTALRYVK